MCTVTILPEALLSAGRSRAGQLRMRVACNRDELLTRTPALPPRLRRIESRLAIMPVDPDTGGTWIGANDSGLVCALLNLHDGSTAQTAPLSRATIIPPLLGCDDLDAALVRVRDLPVDRLLPFRLLVADGRDLVECWTDGRSLEHRRHRLHEAVMRTSSRLGDRRAGRARGMLFRRFLAAASDPIAAEDLFHLHQWRGREEVSVRMRRADARTVSHTVIEIGDRSVSLSYRPAEAPERVTVTVAA